MSSSRHIAYVLSSGNDRLFTIIGDGDGRNHGQVLPVYPAIATAIGDIALSRSGRLMAVGFNTASGVKVTVYRRNAAAWEPVWSYSNDPASAISCLAWSPDDRFLAIGRSVTGAARITLLERNGETFTAVPLGTLPSANVRDIEFTEDGRALLVATDTAPGLMAYEVAGGAFNVMTISPAATAAREMSLCPDCNAVMLWRLANNTEQVYALEGAAFVKKGINLEPTYGDTKGAAFFEDGEVMFVASGPRMIGLRRDGGGDYVRDTDLDTDPIAGGVINRVARARERNIVYGRTSASPMLSVFEWDGQALSELPYDEVFSTNLSLPIASNLAVGPELYVGRGLLYDHTLAQFFSGAVSIPDLKIALLADATYENTHTTFAEVTDSGALEVHGNNWPQGGVTLTGVTFENIPLGMKMMLNNVAHKVIGGDLTASAALIYDASSGAPLVHIDFEGEFTAAMGEQWAFEFADNGLIAVTQE